MNTLFIKSFWLAVILGVMATGCGTKGDPGSQGLPGAEGVPGQVGQPGQSGDPGSPGTVITPIQLCQPEFVPTYPSTFPEYALCISNKMYGVYSANGGFLALLPPGTYTSNGVGASCTVTIGENCQVTN